MQRLKMSSVLFGMAVITAVFGYQFARANINRIVSDEAESYSEPAPEDIGARTARVATLSYRLDASQSKFIAHALPGGLLWFKGHEHLVGVRDFTGEAQLTQDSINPASLEITAKTESMVETSDVFTEAQKQIINKELREIVLEPAKYPDIRFRSTSVTGKAGENSQYNLKIAGDLTLHGVTRQITIPTTITVAENELRAHGEFSIDRSDFKVEATSAVHGLVRVRNRIKFSFDILGHRL